MIPPHKTALPSIPRPAAFMAEDAAEYAAHRRRVKRVSYGIAAIFALVVGGFVVTGFF